MAYGALTQYGGGAVANVALPNRIKCARCNVKKGPNAYATNRQTDLKVKIKSDSSFDATTQGHIVCLACSQVGGNVVELYCNGCDKVKGINAFSKAQRKNPDKAECWPCVETRLNTEPGAGSDSDTDSSVGSGDDSDDSGYDGGTRTVTGTLSTLSIANGDGGAAVGGGSSYATYTSGGGTSTGGVTLSSRAPSVADSVATNRSVMAPPHKRFKAPSSVAGSEMSTTSNFAKIRAVPQQVKMAEAQRVRDQDKADEEDVHVADSDSDTD